EMAIADRSEKLGRKVELVLGEDPFDPKQAVAIAEKLILEGVWGVVGHFYSSSSIPASAVYYQAGVPMVTATSTHPRLTEQGFDNVFRVSGRDDQQALSAADFILSRLKARRLAVVNDRTEYGRGLADKLLRTVEHRAGQRLVVAEEEIAQGDKDFTAVVARLKMVQPDVVYFGGVFREGGYLVRQMRQASLTAAFVSGDRVLEDPGFVKIAGEEAASGSYLTFAPDPRLLPSARSFIQRFESRHGPIGPYVLYTYDAVGVLLRAIQVAKPLTNSREELGKVLKVMHGQVYDGTLGRLRWDKNGDLAASPYVVYVARKGGSLQGWFEQLTGMSPLDPRVPSVIR
ncbi:MAG TPA: branched-chain amino acid ABC transporter substrate-binding protein, partial [Candidatus Methylomirabilis sp.]|nr:branched-chain amino acid ABC transporter substrate-binding protein [Candidatus Methylomirabilis sp.]